jgi:hypothetical protein
VSRNILDCETVSAGLCVNHPVDSVNQEHEERIKTLLDSLKQQHESHQEQIRTLVDAVKQEHEQRIETLNDKATQLLVFLSFAIVGAATVSTTRLPANAEMLRSAMRCWAVAVFPVLYEMLPLKDFGETRRCYAFARYSKIVALWLAVLLSGWGVFRFFQVLG